MQNKRIVNGIFRMITLCMCVVLGIFILLSEDDIEHQVTNNIFPIFEKHFFKSSYELKKINKEFRKYIKF